MPPLSLPPPQPTPPTASLSFLTNCPDDTQGRLHTEIWNTMPGTQRCGFCGLRWPMSLNVDTGRWEHRNASPLPIRPTRRPTNTQVSSSSSTSGHISSLSPLTRSVSPAVSSPIPGRLQNLKQFRNHHKEATKATRAENPISPWENPVGLNIRIKVLHSVGNRLEGGFFKAVKTTQLDSHDLKMIPWATIERLERDDFIKDYNQPKLGSTKIDPWNIQFGVSYEREKANKSSTGHFIAVAFDCEEYPWMSDLLGRDNNYPWAIEGSRVIIWIDLRFVKDQPKTQPTEAPKRPRGRPPLKRVVDTQIPSIEDPEELRERTEALQEMKTEVPIEVITLDAFPQVYEEESQAVQEEEVEEVEALPQVEVTGEDSDGPLAASGHEDQGPAITVAQDYEDRPRKKRQRTTRTINHEPGRGRSRYGRPQRATSKARVS